MDINNIDDMFYLSTHNLSIAEVHLDKCKQLYKAAIAASNWTTTLRLAKRYQDQHKLLPECSNNKYYLAEDYNTIQDISAEDLEILDQALPTAREAEEAAWQVYWDFKASVTNDQL